jgi:hypothetical protein
VLLEQPAELGLPVRRAVAWNVLVDHRAPVYRPRAAAGGAA